MRTSIDLWVRRSFEGSTFANGGGQRLVYHVPSESAALKIWVTADPLQHERHVREISALSRLDHPALPRVVAPIAQIEIDSQVLAFYLEQWLDAPSLKSQLSQFPFEDQRVRGLGASIADALAALHAVDIVHRDVSLGNVLASPNAGYLTDLGLAKHLDLDSLTAAVEAADLEGLNFHDLRRTNATAMVAEGVDVKTAQARLGHTDPRLTLAIYAQATTDGDREAAKRLGARLMAKPQNGKSDSDSAAR
ncbi:MAG TPA: tyrosine-type recombinase/integrase [Acidimicrobiia bacterium]